MASKLIQIISVTPDPTVVSTTSDVTQTTDPGLGTAAVTRTPLDVTDKTVVDGMTSSHKPSTAFIIGTRKLTYTTTDINDNVKEPSLTVTILGKIQ